MEFVIVLPVLLFILFAIVELSRAWLTLHIVTTAAREAARMATVVPGDQFPDPPAAIARIDSVLGAGTWTGGVTCSVNPCVPDSIVQATVSVPFNTVVPLILPMLQAITIQQTTSMRYE